MFQNSSLVSNKLQRMSKFTILEYYTLHEILPTQSRWPPTKHNEIKCKITLSLYDQETQNWISYTRWFTNWRDIQAWNKTSNLTNLIFDNQIFFWVIYVVSP
jgi:hypothetical protein